MTTLTPIEARVVGSLIEKSKSTPDYYPLTVNSLVNACNQKSNRDPVMELDEPTVVRVLDSLMVKGFAGRVMGGGSRVEKFRHVIGKALEVDGNEMVLIGLLLLRGPQTTGELKTRSSSMEAIADLETVENILNTFANREEPLVIKLPRQPGQKENRWMHLLCGPVDLEALATHQPEVLKVKDQTEARIQSLEAEVTSLKSELESIKADFETFKKGFE